MKTNSDTTPQLYIGLDVHKEQTSVAIADPGADGEIRSHGNISTTQPSIDKVLRRLAKARGLLLTDLHICYEAGGCGMWIARQLAKINEKGRVSHFNKHRNRGHRKGRSRLTSIGKLGTQ